MVDQLVKTLHISHTLFYTGLFALLILSSLVLGLFVNRVLHHWGKKRATGWSRIFIAFLEPLVIPLFLLCAIYLGVESLPLPHQYERIASKIVMCLVLLVIVYFPARVLTLTLRGVSERDPSMNRVTQPAIFVVRLVFIVLAIVLFLENLGFSLTALWTTLGVGSIAVALALQETLSNLFSGLYLLADRPMSPGDYIKLETQQEGFVVRVGWRSTTLHTLGDYYIVVPNAILAKSVITNFSEPAPHMGFGLPVNVVYGTDPARVEKALVEIARDAIRDGLEGLLAEPPPSVSFIPGFGESSLGFTLGLALRRYGDQYRVQSDLRKRIAKKFREEGIEMPFPTRTIVFDKSVKDVIGAGTEVMGGGKET